MNKEKKEIKEEEEDVLAGGRLRGQGMWSSNRRLH